MAARLIVVVGLFLVAQVAVAEEWKPLFNGKDLKGWTPKIRGHEAGENFADTFRVEDGLLKVRFDKYEGPYRGRYGHLFYNEPFSHYRIRVECRSIGDQVQGGPGWARRNNGLMLHAQSPQTMVLDQEFPVSLELQILTQLEDGKPRSTANLCTPGTNVFLDGKLHTPHCTSSTSKTIPDGEWATIEAEVLGGETIKHFVNGEQVMEYSRPQLDPADKNAQRLLDGGSPKELTKGLISIQAESAPYDFRKIEVMVLSP